MKNLHIVLLGILLFLLQNCCNITNQDKTFHDSLSVRSNEFLGEWYSVDREYPFESILKIESNYNFTYEGAACMSLFFSNGHWILNEDTLILNSVIPQRCYYLDKFGVGCKIAKIGEPFEPLATSIKECVPSTDSVFSIFEDEKFIVRDSLLLLLQKPNRLCPNVKDDFIRKK